jgi:hypothetical protein
MSRPVKPKRRVEQHFVLAGRVAVYGRLLTPVFYPVQAFLFHGVTPSCLTLLPSDNVIRLPLFPFAAPVAPRPWTGCYVEGDGLAARRFGWPAALRFMVGAGGGDHRSVGRQ